MTSVNTKAKFIFSIDWEDFSQLTAKYKYDEITPIRPDLERQTNLILDLCNKYNIKATFFILGIAAADKKNLVKLIQKNGHEIALHGHFHENLTKIDNKRVKEDIITSKSLIEDLTGEQIFGYRAPFYSMTKNRLEVLDILAESGLIYDSSIFPSTFSKFGIGDFNPQNKVYELANHKTIVELPLSTFTFANQKLSVSGGSYMRITPQIFLKNIFEKMGTDNETVMLYMHPYEFDNQSIDVTANFPESDRNFSIKNSLLNLRWNVNRKSITYKVEELMKKYTFTTCIEVVNGILEKNELPIKLNY